MKNSLLSQRTEAEKDLEKERFSSMLLWTNNPQNSIISSGHDSKIMAVNDL
jgi:hypothetical protein